jgi:linoleoyl-CoA desaturase
VAIKLDHECKRQDEQSLPAAAPGELKFGISDGFHEEVRRRVDAYFLGTGRKPRDCPQMYLKTALVLGWFAASYALLVFVVQAWWLAVPLVLSLGLSMAAIGFNIQHDGGHRAYSERRWINKLMALSLDLLGASSYIWARKHNAIHHSYTNIVGHDDDIDLGCLARLAPEQKRRKFHRLQHFYLWALYGLMPVKWQLYDNFHAVITGRLGGCRLARPKGWDLATFAAGKVVFFSLAFALPLLLHPAWIVLLFYAAAACVAGVVLGVVFQLAHCVEEASFPLPGKDPARMEAAWAVHQLETTLDFARGNRLLSWFIGGLNFQIEHHLFPQVCHVHYPALAGLVEEASREFGLSYKAHKTFWKGITSHYRWLRQMGMPGTA